MTFYSYQNPGNPKTKGRLGKTRCLYVSIRNFRILIFSLIDAWIETAQYNTPLIMLALLTCDFYQVPILRTSQKS